MKITKQTLKKIILEEIGLMNEISNDKVQVATAQHFADSAREQINNVNNSRDDDILEQVHDLANDMNKFVMGLDDGSKKGALVAAISNILNIVNEIEMENS